MYANTFESLGLSPNEAKIYETLLYAGEAGVSEISVKSKVHRRNVYDALSRLIEKGLVFTIFQKGENRYQSVTPDKLMEILHEKERKLNDVLPDLRKIYEEDEPIETAFIYKGLEGFKNYMRDLVRVSQDTYFLGAKALWFSPGIDKSFLQEFVRMSKKRNIKYYTIYDPRIPEKAPYALKEVGGEYRVLPMTYKTPGVLDIFGDYVVTFTSVGIANFGEDGTIFVMRNPELAESYRTWFQFIWDHCPLPSLKKK